MPEISDIIGFYSETGTDNKGRVISDIWKWDYQQLEEVHDYIQWIFPLDEPSQHNASAPVLTPQDISEFNKSTILKFSLLNSLDLMLGFYGFSRDHQSINKTDKFQERISVWLTPGNHNFLRISRILKSLRLLGLNNYALAFLDQLSAINKAHPNIIDNSLQHWNHAVDKG